MNQEEKQYMELLEHTVDLFEREVDAKDALIREQANMIRSLERHIEELKGLMNEILKP